MAMSSFDQVSIHSWTKQHVKDWIDSLKMPPNMKSEIITKVEEFDVNGETFDNMRDQEDVQDALDLKKMAALKVFQELVKQREKQPEGIKEEQVTRPSRQQNIDHIQAQLENQFANNVNLNNNNDEENDNNYQIPNNNRNDVLRNSGKFYLNILRNNQPKTLDRTQVTPRSKIYDVKQIICDHEGGEVENLELTCKGVTLQNDKMLKEYGIENDRHCLVAIFKVVGGSHYGESTSVHRLNPKNPLIKLSKNACCISFETDEDFPRAEMPCKHAITSESMFQYIQMCGKHLKIIDIKCPVKGCGQVWDFDLCSVVGDLTQKEYLKYSSMFEQRRMALTHRACPNCQTFIKRPVNVPQFRIHCTACDGDDFCFLCNKKWIGEGMQVCGHDDCGTQEINQTLKNCKMVQPAYIDNFLVPEYRACPVCLTLIGHKSDCKIMTCYQCTNTHFCFSCLKSSLDGSYPCDYNKPCIVVERQKLN